MNEESLSLVKSKVRRILENQKLIGENQDYSILYVDIVEVAKILRDEHNSPCELASTKEICYLWMILARSSYRIFHQSRPRCKDYIDLSIESWRSGLKYAEDDNEIDCLKEYATTLLARNDSFSGLSDLNEAEELLDKLLFLLPQDHPYIAESLNILGMVLDSKFKRTGNKEDLQLSIDSIRKALELSREGRDDIPDMLDNLGNALEARFDTHGIMDDLDEAVLVKRRAVMLTPDDDSHLPGRMTNLGNALKSRFDTTGDIIHLEESITLRRRSLELANDENPHIARIHNNLGSSLFALFNERGNRHHLDEAIYSYRRSIELTPDGHPDLPRMLSNLGSALIAHYGYTADALDLEQALNYQKRSAALLPEDHPDIPGLLNNLSYSLLTMFECNGDMVCLEESIAMQSNNIKRTPDDHPEMLGRLGGLANALHIKFNHTGNNDVLDTALTLIKKSVDLSPTKHPELPSQLHNLGLILRSKFTLTGNVEDLDASVQAATKSLELIPDNHLNMPAILCSLAIILLERFETTGNTADLEKAINSGAIAVELTPEGHRDMPERLNAYAIALLTRFEHTVDMDDLERAVHANERAIALTAISPMHHPNLQKWWGAHGRALIKRFEVGGNTEDIDQAIHLYEMSIELMSECHIDFPGKLTNLSIALQIRANHRSNINDLRQAILLARRAVDLTPKGHTALPSVLNNLGTALLDKYERTKYVEDLEESILVKRECVQQVSEDDPQMPRLLNNLGKTLQLKYDVQGDVNDLKDALTICENALNLLPDGHPLKIMCHCSTGEILSKLGSYEQDLDYLRRSSHHFKASVTNTAYPSHVRVYAAQLWGYSHNSLGQKDQDIMDAFSIAFDLLPRVIPLTYTIGHRYDRIKTIQGLGISACAVAIAHGDYKRAVEWSDQSRGIFWMQIHHLRSPIESVYKVNPDLANKLKEISLRLQSTANRGYINNGLANPQEIINFEAESRGHNALVEEWEHYIQQARSYAGLENLLLPTPYSEMVKCIPPKGKVIIVNVGRSGSDALVLSNNASPVHIPLPTFPHKLAESLRRQLYAALKSDAMRTRGPRAGRPVTTKHAANLFQILSTLWCDVVEPIFQVIGVLNGHGPNPLLRIWWCPTGPLTFLPIHAAGIYGGNATQNNSIVSNYAVSSYIPTVSALMNLTRHTNDKTFRGMLAVSQANHPDLPELPATILECETIHDEFSNRGYTARHLEGEEATRANILEHMEKYNWIHLSCHGSQQLLSPTDSAFYLHGDNLTLMDIIRNEITNADFAFLSACQTASGTPQLSSEAVHLAGGMLAAGYHSVVATLWSIDDEHALFITKQFYAYLLENTTGGILDSSNAAEALQYATSRLRETLDTSEESLMAWVPYVHIGL